MILYNSLYTVQGKQVFKFRGIYVFFKSKYFINIKWLRYMRSGWGNVHPITMITVKRKKKSGFETEERPISSCSRSSIRDSKNTIVDKRNRLAWTTKILAILCSEIFWLWNLFLLSFESAHNTHERFSEAVDSVGLLGGHGSLPKTSSRGEIFLYT